jgi:hypothetical protein
MTECAKLRIAVRYSRYVLSSLLTIGFGRRLNQQNFKGAVAP